jgi:Phosphotransferase enzyme family
MASGSQLDCYRAIVLRNRGAELLTVSTECGLVLPSVEIPRWQRVAVNLTGALTSKWGCETICLFSPQVNHSSDGSKRLFWQVMECCQHAGTTNARAEWTRVSSLSADFFANSEDYIALRQSLDQLLKRPADNSRPFLRLGWFEELQAWVEDVSRPLGVKLTGKFSQFNASPSFSLFRFETSSVPLWFKAVGVPNQHEFPITIALSRLATKYLPATIATRPAWRGWLMKDAGTPLSEIVPTLDEWRQVATDLAGLQIESIPRSQELLSAGTKDLRTPMLLNLVDPFLDTMDTLMRQQLKPSPPPLSSEELFQLGVRLKDVLAAIDQIGFPATLGHSDFNLGNVLWTGNASVFIDWAEAHFGHPFFTFEYLLSQLRRDRPDVALFEDFIRTAYTQPWKYIVSAQSIADTLAFSPLVATFAYAVAQDACSSRESEDPQARAFVRSLTRRMKREADQLHTRRMACLQC